MRRRLPLALLLALLALPLAQAAEQPREVPTDFRNGQSTAFGSIEMEPYVFPAGPGEPVPVEARIVVHELGLLRRAEQVMLAFSLHGRVADLEVDGAFTEDGEPVPALRTGTAEGGRQVQSFLSADELVGRAGDGDTLALTFRGRATPTEIGQLHVGALVVAYTENWAMVDGPDGPAQLYAYSLVQSKEAGGGLMPFKGQGNTMMVLPLILLSGFVLVAGGLAVQVLRAGVDVPPAQAPLLAFASRPVAAPSPSPRPAGPASPAPPPAPAAANARRVLMRNTEIELGTEGPAPAPAAAAPRPAEAVPVFGSPASAAAPAPLAPASQPTSSVPVFGSPVSPALRKAEPAAAAAAAPWPPPGITIASGPVQGPLLPPHWKGRPFPPARPPERQGGAKAEPAEKPKEAEGARQARKEEKGPKAETEAPAEVAPAPAPSAVRRPNRPAARRTRQAGVARQRSR